MIVPVLCNIEWINADFSETNFSTRNLLIQCLLRYAVGTVYVLNIGFWRSPTIVFEVGFVKSDSKIVSWYQLALLAAVANSKTSWAKKYPSASSWTWKRTVWFAKWFSNLGSTLRGFIAPASNADVYTSAYFALQNTCWEIPNPWTASRGCRLF